MAFDDVTEAAEAVMTASLLMRMLDKIERRIAFEKLALFDANPEDDSLA